MIINSLRIISEISGRNYQIVRKNLKPKKKNKKNKHKPMHHLHTENTLKTMKKLSKDNVGHIIRQP